MNELTDFVAPALFRRGSAREYAVEVLKNGGLGTRHLPSNTLVPHVLAKAPADALKNGIPAPGGSKALMQLAQAGGQALQLGLSGANLAVGLLNLGVSAWTAWKVHGMDRKLDSIADGVSSIDQKVGWLGDLLGASVTHLDRLISQNALLLGLVLEHQEQLGLGFARLRQELALGFRSLRDALSSAEARREAQQFEQQLRSVFRYYELCSKEMQSGRPAPEPDLRRIIDLATELIAWLDTRAAALCIGAPQRLPLMIARALALRLELDARGLLEQAVRTRDAELVEMQTMIAHELRALVSGAPVLTLAVERRVLIEQYIYLHRALRGSATMVQIAEGHVVPFYPQQHLTWDDGLDRVRELVAVPSDTPAPGRLELRTLEEHSAWQRLAGLPRGTSDDDVSLPELERVLGIPQGLVVSEPAIRELLRAAPAAAGQALGRITGEVA